MKFCWVTLLVNDFNQSLQFYSQLLGLAIQSQVTNERIEMAMLGEKDKPQIELLYTKENTDLSFQSSITIGIEVESLKQTIQVLKENDIEIIRGPISPTPKLTFLFINDPNGYEIQLVEMKN